MKRVKSFAVWFNLAWPNWFSNGSREELVSTDYLGRSIVSLVTVRQLSNAFRLSAYLVTLRMTRVLEFPRASSRNGIQTLRVIHVQEINSNDSRISRADLNIIEVQGKNPREWISPERPSIDYLSDWTRSFTSSKRRQRRPFRLDRKLFHRFHSGERSSFSRIPSGKLPRIISNPSVSAEETRKNVTRSSSEREEESRRREPIRIC